MTQKDWQEITQETFGKLFKKTAVKRTKFEGLQRNISFFGGGVTVLCMVVA